MLQSSQTKLGSLQGQNAPQLLIHVTEVVSSNPPLVIPTMAHKQRKEVIEREITSHNYLSSK